MKVSNAGVNEYQTVADGAPGLHMGDKSCVSSASAVAFDHLDGVGERQTGDRHRAANRVVPRWRRRSRGMGHCITWL
jgi:hypothetical protein